MTRFLWGGIYALVHRWDNASISMTTTCKSSIVVLAVYAQCIICKLICVLDKNKFVFFRHSSLALFFSQSYTNIISLSLSLSLTHTHTHTHIYIYIYIYILLISSWRPKTMSVDSLYIEWIYEGFHLNLWECSMLLLYIPFQVYILKNSHSKRISYIIHISSRRADITDPLLLSLSLPGVPIGYRSWLVFWKTSHVLTKLVYLRFCWEANTAACVFQSSQKKLANDFALTFPSMPSMYFLCNLWDGW